MSTFLVVLHVMVCLVIVVVVLLQRGKGAEIGAVFGGGASSTVFGSRGAGNFLTKITTGAAVTFMGTSMALAYFNAEARQGEKLFDDTELEASESPTATTPDEEASPFGEFGEFGEVPAAEDPAAEAPAAEDPAAEAPAAGAPPETPPGS